MEAIKINDKLWTFLKEIPSAISRAWDMGRTPEEATNMMQKFPKYISKLNIPIDCATSVKYSDEEMMAIFIQTDANGVQCELPKNLLKHNYSIEELKADFEFKE